MTGEKMLTIKGHVFEMVIIDRPTLLSMWMCKNSQALIVTKGISDWLNQMAKRSKPQRFLCLNCETTFHERRRPEAFAVVIPFAQYDGQILVTGVCQRCAKKDTEALLQRCLERLQVHNPELTKVQPGQA